MKTYSSSAYEAPQAELIHICVEENLLQSQTGTGSGANAKVTFENESDFDEFFGS